MPLIDPDTSPEDVLQELFTILSCQPEVDPMSLSLEKKPQALDFWKRRVTTYWLVERYGPKSVHLTINSESAHCNSEIKIDFDDYIGLLSCYGPGDLMTLDEWYDQILWEWHEILLAQ